MGIAAVLVNVLIDKGVITENELRERFEQSREAARQAVLGSRSCWRTSLRIWSPSGRTDERHMAAPVFGSVRRPGKPLTERAVNYILKNAAAPVDGGTH
jgi:hypothetical protein